MGVRRDQRRAATTRFAGRRRKRQLRSAYTGGVGLEGLSAMPQPRKFASANPPIGLRRCPSCGLPMLLSLVELSDDVGRDERTFECAACAYAETTTVRVR